MRRRVNWKISCARTLAWSVTKQKKGGGGKYIYFTKLCIMDEEKNLQEKDTTSDGQEEDLITGEDDENPEIDVGHVASWL